MRGLIILSVPLGLVLWVWVAARMWRLLLN